MKLLICIFVPLKKAFYILFAFYFLTLAIIPCGDQDDCKESHHTEQMASTEHHDHEDESCTPLCVCSCCAAHIVVGTIENNLSSNIVATTVYTEATISKPTSAIIPIWQPPKLA